MVHIPHWRVIDSGLTFSLGLGVSSLFTDEDGHEKNVI